MLISLGSVVTAGVLQDLLRPTLGAWGSLAELNEWLFTANGLSLSGRHRPGLSWSSSVTPSGLEREKPSETGFKASCPTAAEVALTRTALLLVVVFSCLAPDPGALPERGPDDRRPLRASGLGLNIVVGYRRPSGSRVRGLLRHRRLYRGGSDFTGAGLLQLCLLGGPSVCHPLGVLFGVLLGIPVLKMRGDYLAIATLGFGEIIRILVLSDFLRPWLGGAQGIGKIPKAAIGRFRVRQPPADLLSHPRRLSAGRSLSPGA